MNEEKTIYDLKLHEQLKISTCIYVTRVPGGWLYDYYEDGQKTACFVPYSNEFIEAKQDKFKDKVVVKVNPDEMLELSVDDDISANSNKREMTQIEIMLGKILMENKGAFYQNEINVINEWLKQFNEGIDYFFNN